MQLPLLAMALMRLMVVPIMGEWASIVEPTMVIQLTGTVVPAMPMERAAVRPPGTMARGAPRVGVGARLRGIMDREAPAVSEAARPRGAAALGAQRDGEEAVSPGVAALALFAEPDQTSPAAKVPGQLVSNGLGGRLMFSTLVRRQERDQFQYAGIKLYPWRWNVTGMITASN